MVAPTPILKNDREGRFSTLMKGFNLRWPSDESNEASQVYLCRTEVEIKDALVAALKVVPPPVFPSMTEGEERRITVRSGGHCYEGFVSNNPDGVIIDVGLVAGLHQDVPVTHSHTSGILEKTGNVSSPDWVSPEEAEKQGSTTATYGFKLLAGTQNWNAAVELFKISGKLIPGGSCYSVGAGGHICGGGYGLSSRRDGLTVDYLAAVDILIVQGTIRNPEVRWVHANKDVNSEIYKFCRGGGGGNIGIITAYYFEPKDTTDESPRWCYPTLPKAPPEVALMMLDISWDENFPENTKGEADFAKFLHRYAQYFKENDRNPSTWGLFTLLKIYPRSTGSIKLNLQYCNNKQPDDHSKSFQELKHFLAYLFDEAGAPHNLHGDKPVVYKPSKNHTGRIVPGIVPLKPDPKGHIKDAPDGSYIMDWLDATQTFNGVPNNQRSTYKSSYMKDDFDEAAIDGLWKYFGKRTPVHKDNTEVKINFNDTYVQIDSYGGKINEANLDVIKNTAIFQRKSILKLQYMAYWWDPSEDEKYQNFLNGLYDAVHAGHVGNGPYPYKQTEDGTIELDTIYEGCYINYPDVQMTAKYQLPFTATDEKVETPNKNIGPIWVHLYYGKDLFEELANCKLKVDPRNIFRHQMSIPPLANEQIQALAHE